MIPRSTDGKTRVLSLSYGKDSMACLGAIEKLGWTLDRIVTADVWATDTIPADLPPMVEFKDYADKVIKERYGIEVEHYCAKKVWGVESEKITYEDGFYHKLEKGKHAGNIKGFPITNNSRGWCKHLKDDAIKQSNKATYEDIFYKVKTKSKKNKGTIYGFPMVRGAWCNSDLKMKALSNAQATQKGCIQYIGIAVDEPNRFHNLSETKLSPLVEIGWTEADAKQWCIENDLLSPIYTDSARGGCWFCHNQGIGQLRLLRKNYPSLWEILLRWDSDSPVAFKPNGKTVHDYDKRFMIEDSLGRQIDDFRWNMLEQGVQLDIFDLLREEQNDE